MKKVREFEQQSKSLDSENSGLQLLVESFKDPNDGCEFVMVSLSLNVSIDKINQVFSIFLSKLMISYIKSLSLTGGKASLMNWSKSSLILFVRQ